MRWVMYAIAALIGLILLAALVGLTRPREHVARTRAEYAKPPAEVWRVISDFDRWPDWNPEITAVQPLPEKNGHRVVNVKSSWGDAPTEFTVWEPPSKLRSDMNAGSFSGSWTYELAPIANGGTLLTVTEQGEVGNPLFRTMMLFHDNYETMTSYHHALAKRLGVSVQPVRVE
jgi:uncharacterized protein YndB with AHSA1/START domain